MEEKPKVYIARSARFDRFAFATLVHDALVGAGQKDIADELLDQLDTEKPSMVEDVARICKQYVQITYKQN